MPDRYNFKCRDCGFIEFRYRNVKRCRKCHSLVDAQKPPTYAELQSTITAQEDIIKQLKEDANFWVAYYLDDIDIDQVAEQLHKHGVLMNELGERQ